MRQRLQLTPREKKRQDWKLGKRRLFWKLWHFIKPYLHSCVWNVYLRRQASLDSAYFYFTLNLRKLLVLFKCCSRRGWKTTSTWHVLYSRIVCSLMTNVVQRLVGCSTMNPSWYRFGNKNYVLNRILMFRTFYFLTLIWLRFGWLFVTVLYFFGNKCLWVTLENFHLI